MAFELPPLPYSNSALEPHISAKTLDFHHGKHHSAYVSKTNELIDGSSLAAKTLEDIIIETFSDSTKSTVFNNAAQVWNHTFFWSCMKPAGGGTPPADVAAALDSAFGSLDEFKEEFKNACTTQFGSGWGWLVADGGQVAIMKTPNAENPMAHGKKALLTCDVWEHAYYLDYQNRRPDFVQAFLDHLINWDFVAQNLAGAR